MFAISRPPTQSLPTVISSISQTLQKIITVEIDKQNNVLGLAFSSVNFTIESCESLMDLHALFYTKYNAFFLYFRLNEKSVTIL